jgi:hypothetical protein
VTPDLGSVGRIWDKHLGYASLFLQIQVKRELKKGDVRESRAMLLSERTCLNNFSFIVHPDMQIQQHIKTIPLSA